MMMYRIQISYQSQLFPDLFESGDHTAFDAHMDVLLDGLFDPHSGVSEYWDMATLQTKFEHLVSTYHPYLSALAYWILGDWHASQDVVQEAWLRAFISLRGRCEQEGEVHMPNMRGFLGVIVRRVAYNHYNREHHFHFVSLEAPNGEKVGMLNAIEADECEQPQFSFLLQESRTSLAGLISSLPVNYRLVIIHRFYLEHTYEETASVLGWSVGKVKCYQHRALKRLRLAAADREIMPEDLHVWSDYSRRGNWLWNYMMRFKNEDSA